MASTWWSKDTVAVVTGANRGIGLEIVRILAKKGLTAILTARDETKGKAAVDDLQAKGLKSVIFHQLDPSDAKSVEGFATWLKSEYGGVDILVNNAGTMGKSYDYETAQSVLNTNYYGVKRVDAALLPLLKPSPNGARIVNVSSRAGLEEKLPSEALKNIFRDEDKYSEKLADSLAEKYLADLKAGKAEEEGWLPNKVGVSFIYSESKLFLNVYAIALGKSLASSRPEGSQIFVASMCPGVTLTDLMRRGMEQGLQLPEGFPVKTAAEGAETAIWLALLPKGEWKGKTGKLFAEKAEYPFGMKNPPG